MKVVELYPKWDEVRQDIIRIESRCFGHLGNSPEELDKMIARSKLLGVIRMSGRVAGYSCAESKWDDVAYIVSTAIDPEFQNQGYLGPLMEEMEKELRLMGFHYLERDCRMDNGYAATVIKHYNSRVLANWPHKSRFGPMMFIRIKLDWNDDGWLDDHSDRTHSG